MRANLQKGPLERPWQRNSQHHHGRRRIIQKSIFILLFHVSLSLLSQPLILSSTCKAMNWEKERSRVVLGVWEACQPEEGGGAGVQPLGRICKLLSSGQKAPLGAAWLAQSCACMVGKRMKWAKKEKAQEVAHQSNN